MYLNYTENYFFPHESSLNCKVIQGENKYPNQVLFQIIEDFFRKSEQWRIFLDEKVSDNLRDTIRIDMPQEINRKPLRIDFYFNFLFIKVDFVVMRNGFLQPNPNRRQWNKDNNYIVFQCLPKVCHITPQKNDSRDFVL